MSRIYCTKKLQNFIGNVEKELPKSLDEISINDWNAHLFFIDKRKCLIFVNNLTFYTIFLTYVLKKDLKNIDSIFYKRLREQLIHDKLIENSKPVEYIFTDPKIKFYKTNNNRKVIGRINDFSSIFKHHCFYKYKYISEMSIVHENGLINETPTGKLNETKKSWSSPIKNVIEIVKTAYDD